MLQNHVALKRGSMINYNKDMVKMGCFQNPAVFQENLIKNVNYENSMKNYNIAASKSHWGN